MSGRRPGVGVPTTIAMFRSRSGELPDPSTLAVSRILLATEGRAIPLRAVDFTLELARRERAAVHVFSIARVWGTSFGFPNPGLLPTRKEWAEQRELVARVVKQLERAGIQADGRILATRKATKRIVREAERLGCEVIVMAADAPRNRLVADLMWSQEPYRVRRRARIPVYLVPREDDQ
jgi:nucleotide-binding universal stress UspA family protein